MQFHGTARWKRPEQWVLWQTCLGCPLCDFKYSALKVKSWNLYRILFALPTICLKLFCLFLNLIQHQHGTFQSTNGWTRIALVYSKKLKDKGMASIHKMATDWQVSDVGDTCRPAAGPGSRRSVQIEWISAWSAHLEFPVLLRCPPLACARNYDEYTPFTSYYKKTRRSGKKIKNKVQFGENSTGGSKHDQRASAETNSRSKKQTNS